MWMLMVRNGGEMVGSMVLSVPPLGELVWVEELAERCRAHDVGVLVQRRRLGPKTAGWSVDRVSCGRGRTRSGNVIGQ